MRSTRRENRRRIRRALRGCKIRRMPRDGRERGAEAGRGTGGGKSEEYEGEEEAET